jgi:CHAT domain-containing protein
MRINPEHKSVDSYIAFVLHANADADIEMVDLGDADRIDGLITKYKKAVSASDKGDGKATVSPSKQLYNQVFHPLEQYLGKSKDIFISPDGNLSLIPFEVLQKHDGSFLIEEFTFNYLSAGRDLVGLTESQAIEGKCLLMGAPDFKMASSSSSSERQATTSRYADLSELSFTPLPNATIELDDIRKVMGGGQVKLCSER